LDFPGLMVLSIGRSGIPMMFIRICFVSVLVLLSAFPVLAADDDSNSGLNFDGSFRILTRDDSTSMSNCIGNPISPICAVETYMACQLRHIEGLCEIAMGEKSGPPAPYVVGKEFVAVDGYRIMAIRQYTPEHMPAPSRNHFKIMPWDVGITLDTSSCYGGKCTGPYPHDRVSYLLRKRGKIWFVVYDEGYKWDFTDHCHVGYYDCKFGR